MRGRPSGRPASIAGPLPLRIVVAEACATAEGNPWQ